MGEHGSVAPPRGPVARRPRAFHGGSAAAHRLAGRLWARPPSQRSRGVHLTVRETRQLNERHGGVGRQRGCAAHLARASLTPHTLYSPCLPARERRASRVRIIIKNVPLYMYKVWTRIRDACYCRKSTMCR